MAVAVDCEGVYLPLKTSWETQGCGRCSIVNEREEVVFDTFVYYDKSTKARPHPQVLKLGVTYNDIKPENGAMHIDEVTAIVTAIFDKAAVVVAHALKSEKQFLRYVPWERYKTRDTQQFQTCQEQGGRGLAHLASVLLDRRIQSEEHSSVEDAQATMALYLKLIKDGGSVEAGGWADDGMGWAANNAPGQAGPGGDVTSRPTFSKSPVSNRIIPRRVTRLTLTRYQGSSSPFAAPTLRAAVPSQTPKSLCRTLLSSRKDVSSTSVLADITEPGLGGRLRLMGSV